MGLMLSMSNIISEPLSANWFNNPREARLGAQISRRKLVFGRLVGILTMMQ